MLACNLNFKLILSPQRYSWLSLLASTVLHALPLSVLLQPGEDNIHSFNPNSIPVIFVESVPLLSQPIRVEKKASPSPKLPSQSPKVTSTAYSENEKIESTVKAQGILFPSHGNCPPHYPELAKEQGIEGIVCLRFRVDPHGHMCDLEVMEPRAHVLLERASISALKKWKFEATGVVNSEVMVQEFRFFLVE